MISFCHGYAHTLSILLVDVDMNVHVRVLVLVSVPGVVHLVVADLGRLVYARIDQPSSLHGVAADVGRPLVLARAEVDVLVAVPDVVRALVLMKVDAPAVKHVVRDDVDVLVVVPDVARAPSVARPLVPR